MNKWITNRRLSALISFWIDCSFPPPPETLSGGGNLHFSTQPKGINHENLPVRFARFTVLRSTTSSPILWSVALGFHKDLQHGPVWGLVDSSKPSSAVRWSGNSLSMPSSSAFLASAAGTLTLQSQSLQIPWQLLKTPARRWSTGSPNPAYLVKIHFRR